MYYNGNRNGMNIKNLMLIALTVFCVFCVWQGCSNKENYNKERKDLNKDIKILQNRFDSLQKSSDELKVDYIKYQNDYKRDSLLVDSLSYEYNSQLGKTIKMENKANLYLDKYNRLSNVINKLKHNKSYKTGDSLLRSLGEKIKN